MGLIHTKCVLLTLSFLLASAVHAAPQLRLTQTAVGPISLAVGATGTAPSVDAANAGDGALNLRLTSSAPWIVPTLGAPGQCSLRGACTPIQIALQTASLARGTHTGLITVADPAAIDAPQTISVTVQIGGGVPDRADLFVAPNGMAAELPFSTNNALNASVSTQNNLPFLSLELDGSGSFRFSLPYRIIARPGTLAEGSYTGSIVTSGSPLAADNKTIPVTLRVTSQPIAQFTPERVRFRIAAGSARQTEVVPITNRGLGALNVTGASPAPASGGNWLSADLPAGAASVAITANPAGLAPGTYQGSVSVASNAANTVIIPVELTVVMGGTPVSAFLGVVNNATFEPGGVVAQGDIVAAFGEQFLSGDPQLASSTPLGADLGGTRVFVNDRPAPIYYTSYRQVNFQIPYDTPPGDAIVRIDRGAERGNLVSVRVAARVPRLLRFGVRDYGIITNQDETFAIPTTAGLRSRPARVGETLTIYAIGLGPTTPSAVTGAGAPAAEPLARVVGVSSVTFGGGGGPFSTEGIEATPSFVGLSPNFVGLYQINVPVPVGTPTGNDVPLFFTLEDGVSNRVTIAVQ